MIKHFSLVLVLILSVGLSAQTKTPTTDSQRVEALKLSQMCADSGAKFWAQFEKDPDTAYGQNPTHYNRTLGRCLFFMSSFRMGKDYGVSRKTVWDAIEGTMLADFMNIISTKDNTVPLCYTMNLKGEYVQCVSDERQVKVAESVFDAYRLDVMTH